MESSQRSSETPALPGAELIRPLSCPESLNPDGPGNSGGGGGGRGGLDRGALEPVLQHGLVNAPGYGAVRLGGARIAVLELVMEM